MGQRRGTQNVGRNQYQNQRLPCSQRQNVHAVKRIEANIFTLTRQKDQQQTERTRGRRERDENGEVRSELRIEFEIGSRRDLTIKSKV